jgi:hypothetical protein
MKPSTSRSRAAASRRTLTGATRAKPSVRCKPVDLNSAIAEALMRGKAARASLRKKTISDEVRLAELRQARQSLEYAVERVKRALYEERNNTQS